VVLKAARLGSFTTCAEVQTEEGLKDRKCVTTQITQPGLKLSLSGPVEGVVGRPATFQITVANSGGAALKNLLVRAVFDKGLEFPSEAGRNSLDAKLGDVGPFEKRDLPPLTLTPKQAGNLALRVTAQADGNLTDQTEHVIQVRQAQLKVSMTGPKMRQVGLPAEWEIRVSNPGEVPVTGVLLRDKLPPEVRFQSSTEGGKPGEGEVFWDLGNLGPGQEKRVRVTATAEKATPAAVNRAEATADGGLNASDQTTTAIVGLAAFKLEVKDIGDPVKVGERLTYRIAVTNTGSAPASGVEVKAFIPAELQLVPNGAKGPAPVVVDGQTVTFARVDNVEPQRTLEYNIEVLGRKKGDVRLRVELRGQGLQQPVVEEESTTIYEALPNNGAAPPNPPPPVGGGQGGGGLMPVPAISLRDLPSRLPNGPPPPPPPPPPP
jgi:uncharacterized repeat protein (TIGR01451 family)